MKYAIAFLFLFLYNPETSLEKKTPITFEAKVTAIKDGDTFKVFADGKETTIRLAHVDCPEKKQPFSNNAKQLASDLCFGKTVKVVSDGTVDRYKRLIAEIYVGKKCVNQQLVQNGMAWHYKKYSKSTHYANLEILARKNKVGLWADKEPMAPWEWRKNKRNKKVK
ncbi:endonuclease YncB(thermonuclease family) [Flavobacterium arsenatis]|uniref:Endonuclease YncB(Thermonuclease family) n=1 Tax=Flavobacterium arsenatis TaxID=1484332 RepID=A0ABU1TTU1_9FLAO|nr:thermonuclease family protein [Flavobacterium arsenatis]MDR6969293.1 endonuclease YncB(thermonuclease family) [Flavobacterium arsenatis]